MQKHPFIKRLFASRAIKQPNSCTPKTERNRVPEAYAFLRKDPPMKKALYLLCFAFAGSAAAMDDDLESPRTPTADLAPWKEEVARERREEIKAHASNFESVLGVFLEILKRPLGRGKSKITSEEFTKAVLALAEKDLKGLHIFISATPGPDGPTTPAALTVQNYEKRQEHFPFITQITLSALSPTGDDYNAGTILPGAAIGVPMDSIHVRRDLLESEPEKEFDTIYFGPDTMRTVATRRVAVETAAPPQPALARTQDETNDKDAS
jgi:hypothetical protein